MTKSDLPTIRRVLLEVIDGGDLKSRRIVKDWALYDGDEDFANAQRLGFCDRVAELLAREIKGGTA